MTPPKEILVRPVEGSDWDGILTTSSDPDWNDEIYILKSDVDERLREVYNQGHEQGHDEGYNEGYIEGHWQGHDEGYAEAKED